MKEVTFSVQVKVKDVFCFLMHHANRGAALIINILITVGAIALLVTGYAKGEPVKLVVLVTLALLFTVINPIQLYGRAKKQVQRNPAFAKPLKYTLTEEGITMSQEIRKSSHHCLGAVRSHIGYPHTVSENFQVGKRRLISI